VQAGNLPKKFKDEHGTTWKQVLYDDGETKIFHAGLVLLDEELSRLIPANEARPTREKSDKIAAFQLFAADSLVVMRVAVFTKKPITVNTVNLFFPVRKPYYGCRVCTPENKSDPYKYVRANIPVREKKPVILMVLMPNRYRDKLISAVTFSGGS